jgi:hypothetical protein
MQYQKISKVIVLKTLLILSLSSATMVYADTGYITNDTTLIETSSISLISQLEQLEDPEHLRILCDDKKAAEYCFTYAAYQDLVLENYQLAYEYHMKAFNLGQKESGYYIGAYQINYPEIFEFENDTQLNIDEIIVYLEYAFDVGSHDATKLLMTIYRDPEFNRIDYNKSESYNKIAIEQNIKKSRVNLAYLYMHHMKNKSKIIRTIELLNEDLMLEKNWESALALMTIHLYPEEYGANLEPDLVRTLAYAYVSSDLRDGRYEDEFNGVDTRFAEAMQTELSSETLKQAKAMYLELMIKINSKQVNK